MRGKHFFLSGIALITLALAGGAYADDDNSYDDDSSYESKDYNDFRAYRDFRKCLRTKPIRFHGTIVEAALATPELSTLAFAVDAAGLIDVLNSDGPFTVFAPLNSAFDAVPAPILNALLADTGLLGAVLTYHVIPGQGRRLDPRRVLFPLERSTVLGQTVFFNRSSDGPQVNQSNVECQAVKTNNGTVWLIDSVLLPQF